MKFKSVLFFLLLILVVNMSSVWAMDINLSAYLFNKDSYQEILNSNKNKSFVLLLWSIDCPPCYEELSMIGEYIKKNPQLKIILLSTDSSEQMDEIQQMIRETQLETQELWVFSDAPAQHLRYSIDPRWYGELPRSYLFNQCHERKAVSGKITADVINDFAVNAPCTK